MAWMRLFFISFILLSSSDKSFAEDDKPIDKPNIVIIVADDLGWGDVGFHGAPEVKTPSLDRLASQGVILSDYYVLPICTPTRSALLTGKYPIRMGMQSSVIMTPQAWGLGLNEKLLPQYLKEVGYKTHLIGKWHLGFYAREYTPMFRGFDSFFGMYSGREDYWSYDAEAGEYLGRDLREGRKAVKYDAGTYQTELFTDKAVNVIKKHDKRKPLFLMVSYFAVHSANSKEWLQAPVKELEKFYRVEHEERKKYLAMVSSLDDNVDRIFDALQETGLLSKSVVLFTTDNGAAANGFDHNYGSNFPLRGMKTTLFEGGVRAVGFVYSKLIHKSNRTCNDLIHVTDWFPTFLSLAGIDSNTLKRIDGFDVWGTISKGECSSRTEVLLNIDDTVYHNSAFREGDWKVVNEPHGDHSNDGWYNPPDYKRDDYASLKRPVRFNKTTIQCGPIPEKRPTCDNGCLFNLKSDPCEYVDKSKKEPEIFAVMNEKLDVYRRIMKLPRYNHTDDPRSDPKLHGGFWTPWVKLSDEEKAEAPY